MNQRGELVGRVLREIEREPGIDVGAIRVLEDQEGVVTLLGDVESLEVAAAAARAAMRAAGAVAVVNRLGVRFPTGPTKGADHGNGSRTRFDPVPERSTLPSGARVR